jgi:hypothetical protein
MNNLVNLFFLLSAKYLILFSLILSSFLPVLAAQDSVLIYIRDDVYSDYEEFIAGRDVSAIKNFSGINIRRDVVDMILAQQALKLGGFKYKFTYAPGKVNFRNTQMLQNGELLLSFDSYWKSDASPLSDSIYISDEVIRNGEYVAGIYTSPKNKKTLAVKQLIDLQELTAISTPKWRTDWQTLQQLSLKEIVVQDSWLSMVRMVNLQWVDFILMPFNSTPDKSFTMEKIHLVPVQGIGIILKDSRHFVISKLHPKGSEAFQAINKGLKILRKKGTISKAYEQSGFFIDKTKVDIINL